MDQSAEDVDPLDPAANRRSGQSRHRRGNRSLEVDAPVRATGVVVLEIPDEDTLQVLTVPDQCPVQTLFEVYRALQLKLIDEPQTETVQADVDLDLDVVPTEVGDRGHHRWGS